MLSAILDCFRYMYVTQMLRHKQGEANISARHSMIIMRPKSNDLMSISNIIGKYFKHLLYLLFVEHLRLVLCG